MIDQGDSPFSLKDFLHRFPLLTPRFYAWLRVKLISFEVIDHLVPKEGKILDLGSGFGVLTIALALSSPKRQLIGLEFDPKRVQVARKAASDLPQIVFEKRDFVKDPSLPKDIAAVIMMDVLHHMPFSTQEELFDQCTFGLSNEGTLCIREADKAPNRKYYCSLLHDKIMTLNQPLWFRPSEAFEGVLKKRGFSVKRWTYPHPIYSFVFLHGIKHEGP